MKVEKKRGKAAGKEKAKKANTEYRQGKPREKVEAGEGEGRGRS